MTLRNLLYVVGIGAGFIGLYCSIMFFLFLVSEWYVQKQIAGNTRILSNLEKHQDWWTTYNGKDFYRERTEGAEGLVTDLGIHMCFNLCIEHLKV